MRDVPGLLALGWVRKAVPREFVRVVLHVVVFGGVRRCHGVVSVDFGVVGCWLMMR